MKMSEIKISLLGRVFLGPRIHNKYSVSRSGAIIGTAYKNPATGNYNMTYNGQEFYGSKARLKNWILSFDEVN